MLGPAGDRGDAALRRVHHVRRGRAELRRPDPLPALDGTAGNDPEEHWQAWVIVDRRSLDRARRVRRAGVSAGTRGAVPGVPNRAGPDAGRPTGPDLPQHVDRRGRPLLLPRLHRRSPVDRSRADVAPVAHVPGPTRRGARLPPDPDRRRRSSRLPRSPWRSGFDRRATGRGVPCRRSASRSSPGRPTTPGCRSPPAAGWSLHRGFRTTPETSSMPPRWSASTGISTPWSASTSASATPRTSAAAHEPSDAVRVLSSSWTNGDTYRLTSSRRPGRPTWLLVEHLSGD